MTAKPIIQNQWPSDQTYRSQATSSPVIIMQFATQAMPLHNFRVHAVSGDPLAGFKKILGKKWLYNRIYTLSHSPELSYTVASFGMDGKLYFANATRGLPFNGPDKPSPLVAIIEELADGRMKSTAELRKGAVDRLLSRSGYAGSSPVNLADTVRTELLSLQRNPLKPMFLDIYTRTDKATGDDLPDDCMYRLHRANNWRASWHAERHAASR